MSALAWNKPDQILFLADGFLAASTPLAPNQKDHLFWRNFFTVKSACNASARNAAVQDAVGSEKNENEKKYRGRLKNATGKREKKFARGRFS